MTELDEEIIEEEKEEKQEARILNKDLVILLAWAALLLGVGWYIIKLKYFK